MKTRMRSEERLLNNNSLVHHAMVYYSILLLVLAVFEKQLSEHFALISEYNLFLSIVLTIVSVVLYHVRYDQQADQFKNCYHSLQRMLTRIDQSKESEMHSCETEYNSILQDHPNHPSADYKNFIVEQAWSSSPLKDSGGNLLRPGKSAYAGYIWRKALRYSFVALLFGSPLSLLAISYKLHG